MAREAEGSLVTSYVVKDDQTCKTGILEVEITTSPHRVVNFLEKPDCKDTSSRLACPCFYHLRPEALRLVDVFLEEKKREGAALGEVDATGNFISWLVHQHPVFAAPIGGRLDIGGLVSYREAERYMKGDDTA